MPWLAERDAAHVVEIVQAAGLPCSKVATPTEVLANPQLDARGYWEDVTVDGVRGRMPGSPVLPAKASGPRAPSLADIGGAHPSLGEGASTLTPEGLRSIIAAHARIPDVSPGHGLRVPSAPRR